MAAPSSTTAASAPASRIYWWSLIPARWRRHVWLKSLGTTAFMAVFFAAYFAILRTPYAPSVEIPFSPIDHWIGFHPWALAPYLSLWIYVSLPSSLMVRFRELVAHTLGAAALGGTGLLLFMFWPTSTPSSGIDWALYPQFQFIKGVDTGGNACPSLHVAFAVFAAFWLARMLRRMGAGPVARAGNVIWAALIIFSTVATRQHVVIDVLAGAVLGWFFARLNLRFSAEPVEPAHLGATPATPAR